MNLYNATTHEEVKLPAVLTDFRGDEHVVLGIFSDAEPGKSGKVSVSTGMIYYPGVFGCYIADEPRAETAKTATVESDGETLTLTINDHTFSLTAEQTLGLYETLGMCVTTNCWDDA